MYERQQRTAKWFTADNEMQSDCIDSENLLLEEHWDKTLLQPLVLMNANQKVRLLKLKKIKCCRTIEVTAGGGSHYGGSLK